MLRHHLPFAYSALAILLCGTVAWGQEQMLQQQYRQMTEMAAHLRKADQHHCNEIFQLKIDKGFLVLLTKLHSVDQVRCDIEGLEGITTLRIMGGDDHNSKDGVEPQFFQLSNSRLADGKLRTINITAQANSMVQVLDQEQGGNGFKQLQITQSGTNAFAFGDPNSAATAQMNFNWNRPGANSVNFNITGEHFAGLVKAHRHEVDEYLRPLLSSLEQDGLFASDPSVMSQVFAELWTSDPKLAGEISKRLPDLDADDFRVREKATNELRALGRGAALEAMHMERTGLSAEQAMRLDSLVSQYYSVPAAEVISLRKDPNFMVDCLYGDDPRMCQAALDRLQKILGRDVDFDLKTTGHDRLLAVRKLRESMAGKATSKP